MRHWSTDELPDTQKVDYYASAIETALTPVAIARVPSVAFDASLEAVSCGPLDAIQITSTQHTLQRGERELQRSDDRHFRLVCSVDSVLDLVQRHAMRLRPNEVALLDTGYPHTAEVHSKSCVRHIRIPSAWLRQWLPDPQVLVGRSIPCDRGWGRAMASFAAQLSPSFVSRSPLPLQVLADQLGALLALTSAEVQAPPPEAATAPVAALADRIKAVVAERCSEVDLVPAQVAACLNISVRTLHRSLAARQMTFGELLLASRAELATRMLRNRTLSRLTTSEIGRRAGFVDASHFVRVMRRLVGQTPVQLRNSNRAGEVPYH